MTWERRRYWLPEGFAGWAALGAGERAVLAALADSTRSHHRRQERNYAHEEGWRR